MSETILLQLVSPERMLVEEHVSEVQVPARDVKIQGRVVGVLRKY